MDDYRDFLAPDDPELEQALEKAKREVLERLAGSPEAGALRELAQSLLSGEMTVMDAVSSNVYADALADGMRQFTTWYQDLSEAEREAAANEGAASLRASAEQSPERSR